MKKCRQWVVVLLTVTAPLAAEEQRDEEDKPNLVRQLGTDFKNYFTTQENLVILGAGLGAAWGASYFDDQVATSALNAELNGGSTLDGVFESGEIAGGGYFQFATAAGTFAIGKLVSKPGVEDLGRDLLRAQIVTGTITFALKKAVGRERPDGSSNSSFPSGHTSASFATASVLARHYGWRVGLPAYAFAGYIAGSRLNETKHYVSDVIFGAALGIVGGRTVTIDVAEKRFALLPMVTPDGVGVQLTLIGH